MAEVGDGSMGSPPKFEYLPATENADGNMSVDISDLENPDVTLSNSVNRVAFACRILNKELRVKVPCCHFEFIALLSQMGFNRIVHAESTYIVLKDDISDTIIRANHLHKVAWGVTSLENLYYEGSGIQSLPKFLGTLSKLKVANLTSLENLYLQQSEVLRLLKSWGTLSKLKVLYLESCGKLKKLPMRRENIASSSKPCTLNICSETPNATLAVQTPSETGGDQGPEFQHSNRAFPSGPAGMGNDNEAAGLQGLSAGPEIPECGVQSKKRPHPANESELPSTRHLRPDFKDEEKSLLLQAKLEYLLDPANEGKRLKWLMPVTDKMIDNGYHRDPAACGSQCDRLKKSFDALRRAFPEGSTDYWDLPMEKKKALKKNDPHFPLIFELRRCVAMDDIEKMEPRRAAKKGIRRDGQECVFSQSLASTLTGLGNFAGVGFNEPSSSMVRIWRKKVLAALTDCLEETGDEMDSESEAMDVPTDEEVLSGESGASVESHTEIASADSPEPRTEPRREKSDASAFDEDNLFPKIRSYVNQKIEETLQPLMSALRSREEDEHKHRQKMLALEQEKLALMRQKLECTRRSNAVPASVAK